MSRSSESAEISSNEQTSNRWESKLVQDLLKEAIFEKRANRRWRIFFKMCFWLVVFLVIFKVFLMNTDIISYQPDGNQHSAIVNVHGVIAEDAHASAAHIIAGLRDAFESKKALGVILHIDSPGGSPVEAALVYDEMLRLRKKYPQKPLYAVAGGMCTSAAYYIAVGADKIFVNRNSLVGSIGVKLESFGVVDLLKTVGVERRLMTAGSNKGILDAFSPWREQDRLYVQGLLDEVHKDFISVVEAGRGARLKTGTPDLFSGLFWTGTHSVELGLTDGTGSVDSVARDLIKAEDTKDYSYQPDLARGLIDKLSSSMVSSLRGLFSLQARESVSY